LATSAASRRAAILGDEIDAGDNSLTYFGAFWAA
jgi:hypothetical protein